MVKLELELPFNLKNKGNNQHFGLEFYTPYLVGCEFFLVPHLEIYCSIPNLRVFFTRILSVAILLDLTAL